MPLRSIILIVVALVMAIATAFLARGLLTSGQEAAEQTVTAPAEPSGTRVLVAAQTLPIGKLLTPPDVRWQSWPDDDLPASYLVEGKFNPEAIVGHVVRYGMTAGEPVTKSNVVAPGERGFLAAALTPGMRAMTVAINQVSGISGFVFPGDRVDLILNHEVDDGSGERRKASETVVQNVRVLAVDTRTSGEPNEAGAMEPRVGKTVTLEVTPKIAEKISLIEKMGSLTLALRSLAVDAGETGTPADLPPRDDAVTFTWDSEVSRLLPPVDPEQSKSRVQLSRGAKVSVIEFPKDRNP